MSTLSTIKKQASRLLRVAVLWVPEPYQTRAVKWLLSHAGAGLLLDPGLGKTSITLKAICILIQQGLISRVLIIAPLRVCYLVWPEEIKKWKQFEHLRYSIIHGNNKERALEADADIYLMTPDGVDWMEAGNRFKKLGAEMLVVDESTKFKRSDTERFRTLKKFLHLFRWRWILTGTPTPNGLLDLFGQIYIIDMGRALGQYVTHYRKKFFYATGYGQYHWALQDGMEKEIYKAVKPYVLRLDEADYLTLPPLKDVYIEVELPAKARELYDSMEEKLFIELDEQKIVAPSEGAASMKCRQLAGGAIYKHIDTKGLNIGETYEVTHDAKIEALKELIDERQGKPLIIAYQFRHDLDRLMKALGKNTPMLGGKNSIKKDMEVCDQWNHGELAYILAHPASVGHGLNLQFGGNGLCWFNETWNYEEYDQFIRRVRRRGTVHDRIMNYHIVARDTLDMTMIASNRAKYRTQKEFLDAMKTYRKTRS